MLAGNGAGPPWYPDATNNYSVGSPGPDQIGVGAGGLAWIIQVQKNYKANTLPCDFYNQQTMQIDCPGGTTPSGTTTYEVHTNHYIVGDGTFQVKRNGAASTVTTAGTNRITWKFFDWLSNVGTFVSFTSFY